MRELLLNLVIGIIGGVFSGVIVSQAFLVRDDIEEQMNLLHSAIQRLGSMKVGFNAIESILKLSHDTSDEIKQAIKKDPGYVKTHDLIHANDVIAVIKKELLDTTVDKFCSTNSFTILKGKNFLNLQNEAMNTVRKYREIKEFKFKTIDEYKREIENLQERYNSCIKSRGKLFISLMVHDKVLIGFSIFFIFLCCLLIIMN